jgi:hypothetical protein
VKRYRVIPFESTRKEPNVPFCPTSTTAGPLEAAGVAAPQAETSNAKTKRLDNRILFFISLLQFKIAGANCPDFYIA